MQQLPKKLTKQITFTLRNTFCASTSKYSENYKLEDSEISSILNKVSKKPSVMVKHEFKYKQNYNQDITEQLQQIQENAKENSPISLQQQQQTIEPINSEQNTELEQKKDPKNTEIEVKYYKYGLPIPNLEPELTPLPDPFARPEEEQETTNERVMALLRINENTSYEQFELALKNEFNSEMDMYGDIEDTDVMLQEQIDAIEEYQCIPEDVLSNDSYMDQIRRNITLNLNMPGVMENEHPHKFLSNLRPVEEFRHTPLIPISERQMKDWNERVKAYHRRGFYFEIKKETIYNYAFLGAVCIMGANLVLKAIQREEETGVSVERLKLTRMQNQIV